jgi:autotransporter strand-loop-strand O-heptosyltransferase
MTTPSSDGSATGSAASPAPKPPVRRGAPKPAYPLPARMPTQVGPKGVRFDFNVGARVVTPPRKEGAWGVRLLDLDTGNVLFEKKNQGALVVSAKRFWVRFRIEVFDDNELILRHDYDCRGREVLVLFPVGTLGDTLAWFPYAAKFQQKHGCRMICAMAAPVIPLLESEYPDITFISHEEVAARKLTSSVYATYCMGLFFDDKACAWQPTDFRLVGLHRTAAYILGVDPAESPPRIALSDEGRPIEEPYVCVAVQSSSGCKMWNNPIGWHDVVAHLKAKGYRVVCIDKKFVHGAGLLHTHIPHGVEDETGDRPLTERARWLRHADLFIGLSSGLAWLAWSAGVPVVMISGFTHPTNEFHTPYRVINWHTCNSCWNDPSLRFDHANFMWCPRHENTPRHFECTRLITGAHVISVIDRALADRKRKRVRARGRVKAPAQS